MNRIALTLILCFCLISVSGCSLLETALSDVNGLDLSACAAKLSVCINLFLDNADKLGPSPFDAGL